VGAVWDPVVTREPQSDRAKFEASGLELHTKGARVFSHLRRRMILLAALTGAALAALGVSVTSSRAVVLASSNPHELPVSNFNTPAGVLTALRGGVTYQASGFPLGLRITAPDGTWGGTQWKTTSRGKPLFGWTAFGQGSGLALPLGAIEIETAFGPTPSVAATIARLHTGGSGVTYKATTGGRIAGFSGRQFDGRVFGRFGHVFVPFSAQTGGASPPDSYRLEAGEVFRIVVLNVKGKTVVVFFDSVKLPTERFPAFIAAANRLLRSLTFPA